MEKIDYLKKPAHTHTPWVNISGLGFSIIWSSSSLVIDLPAVDKKKYTMSFTWNGTINSTSYWFRVVFAVDLCISHDVPLGQCYIYWWLPPPFAVTSHVVYSVYDMLPCSFHFSLQGWLVRFEYLEYFTQKDNLLKVSASINNCLLNGLWFVLSWF